MRGIVETLGIVAWVAWEALLFALWLWGATVIVWGLTHLLHSWWAVIPPMEFLTAGGVAVLLVLLVNVLTWLNFAGGSK